jgi:hypothetical protein
MNVWPMALPTARFWGYKCDGRTRTARFPLPIRLEKIVNRILISVLLAFGVGSAFAQSGTVTTIDDKGKAEAATVAQTEAEKAADHYCLRHTGSHLHAITNVHNKRAVECANAPGRVYTREDIDRTGDITTADALRHLDPSIR